MMFMFKSHIVYILITIVFSSCYYGETCQDDGADNYDYDNYSKEDNSLCEYSPKTNLVEPSENEYVFDYDSSIAYVPIEFSSYSENGNIVAIQLQIVKDEYPYEYDFDYDNPSFPVHTFYSSTVDTIISINDTGFYQLVINSYDVLGKIGGGNSNPTFEIK